MKTTYKLGQIIEFRGCFQINGLKSTSKLNIQEGDKALVTRTGFRVLSGEGRGKIINFNRDEQVKGCDYSNISRLIFNRINGVFGLETYLYDEGIDYDEFMEEIQDVLMTIL